MIRVVGESIEVSDTQPGLYNPEARNEPTTVNSANFRNFQPILASANVLVQSVTRPDLKEKAGQDFGTVIDATSQKWLKAFTQTSGLDQL